MTDNLRIIFQHGSIKKSTTTSIHHDIPGIQQHCLSISQSVRDFSFRHRVVGSEREKINMVVTMIR